MEQELSNGIFATTELKTIQVKIQYMQGFYFNAQHNLVLNHITTIFNCPKHLEEPPNDLTQSTFPYFSQADKTMWHPVTDDNSESYETQKIIPSQFSS